MREGARPTNPRATECAPDSTRGSGGRAGAPLVALAAATGLGLMADSLWRSSATYDEVMYLEVAAHGGGPASSRGSPGRARRSRSGSSSRSRCSGRSTAWAMAPGSTTPLVFEARLLPLARISALWIWLAAFGLVAYWSRRLYGPRAMVLAAWWFALSPNLLAHGPLVTMEIPILATMTGMVLLLLDLPRAADRRAFVASAIVGGLAFSCKFTAAVMPPIFALLWLHQAVEGRRSQAGRWP